MKLTKDIFYFSLALSNTVCYTLVMRTDCHYYEFWSGKLREANIRYDIAKTEKTKTKWLKEITKAKNELLTVQ